MFKKLILLFSLAVISCKAAAGDQEEHFATAYDLANRCANEGDWGVWAEYNRLRTAEENDLHNRLWRLELYAWRNEPRTEQQIRDLERLDALRRVRAINEERWMRYKIQDRRIRREQEARRRRRDEANERLYEQMGGRPQTAQEINRERDQQIFYTRRAMENDQTQGVMSKGESISSLHPYLSYSVFGLISLFFMYKFAHKNSEEIKN